MSIANARSVYVLAAALAAACSPQGSSPIDSQDTHDAKDVVLRVKADPASRHETTPIYGVGPANGMLIARVSDDEELSVALGETGDFCLDIPLDSGANEIEVSALDSVGRASSTERLDIYLGGDAVYDITDGSWPSGASPEPLVDDGQLEGLVDGDYEADVTLAYPSQVTREAVSMSLGGRSFVDSVSVTVPAQGGHECAPRAFEVWVSDDVDPELVFDGLTFLKVNEVEAEDSSASGATYELNSLYRGVPARHIALIVSERSCENEWSANEIRVTGAREAQRTCASW